MTNLGENKQEVFTFRCGFLPDPPENCHLTVKKLPLTIMLKKMTIFVNFFEKKIKFLAIF